MPENMRFVLVRSAKSRWELTNLVDNGFPFQKTIASVPKLAPSTSMVKTTLLTGALSGDNAVMEGGELSRLRDPWVAFGSCQELPHPRVIRKKASRLADLRAQRKTQLCIEASVPLTYDSLRL
jgi:hypothetical protein